MKTYFRPSGLPDRVLSDPPARVPSGLPTGVLSGLPTGVLSVQVPSGLQVRVPSGLRSLITPGAASGAPAHLSPVLRAAERMKTYGFLIFWSLMKRHPFGLMTGQVRIKKNLKKILKNQKKGKIQVLETGRQFRSAFIPHRQTEAGSQESTL